MDSVAVTVPLTRPPTKKMKKRKELDALAPPHAISRRSSSGKRSSQELLSDSSDERSEYWNVSTRVRKSGRDRGGRPCKGLFKACSVFLGGTLVLVTVILIWLFIDVRQQLNVLRFELDQVIAGSEGLPDALQLCHTLDKNFRSNISLINSELKNLNSSINNFSGQILSLQQELQLVQNSLKSAPELTQVPQTVNDLQNSIGQLTVDIHDLKNVYSTLQNSTSALQQSQDKQRQSLSKFESTLSGLPVKNEQPQAAMVPTNETLLETKKLWDAVAELGKNLTRINQTLSTNISWAQEDFAKDHKTVVSLQDMAQNASAQILTLQQECVNKKDYEVLQRLIRSLTDRVNKVTVGINNPVAPKEIEQMLNYNSQNSTGNVMAMAASNQANTVVEPSNSENDSNSRSSDTLKSSTVSPQTM